MSAHHRRIVNNPFANKTRRTVGYSEHRYGNSHHHNQHHRGRRFCFRSPVTCFFLIVVLIFSSSWMPYDDQQLYQYATAEKEKTNEQQQLQTGDKPVSMQGDNTLIGEQSKFHKSSDSGDGEHYESLAAENNGSINGEHKVDYRNGSEHSISEDGSGHSNREFNRDSVGDGAKIFDNKYVREHFNKELDGNPTNSDDGEYGESSDLNKDGRVVDEEETHQLIREYEDGGIVHLSKENKNNETASDLSAPNQGDGMLIDKNLANITSNTVGHNDTWNKPLNDSIISDGDLNIEAARKKKSSSSDELDLFGDGSVAMNTTAEGHKSVPSNTNETSSSMNVDLMHATINSTLNEHPHVPNVSTSMDSSNITNISSPISDAESNIVENVFIKNNSTELLSANETETGSKITSEVNSKIPGKSKSLSDTVFAETVSEKENLPETSLANQTKIDSKIANEDISKVTEKSIPSANTTSVFANQTTVENFMANETKEDQMVTGEDISEDSESTSNTTSAMTDVDDVAASANNNFDTRRDTTQQSNTTTNHMDSSFFSNITNNNTDPIILGNSTNNTTKSVKSPTINTTVTSVTNASESNDNGNLRGSMKD